MPRLPLSTDAGPSPGAAGIEDPGLVARAGFSELEEIRTVSSALGQLAQTFSEAGLEMRRREIRTEINNESMAAKEQLLVDETEIRRQVMEDASIPFSERPKAYLERLGERSDALLEDLRFDASRFDVRQTALGLARSGKLALDRESAQRANQAQRAHVQTLASQAGRALIEGDTGRFNQIRGEIDRGLDGMLAFNSPEEVAAMEQEIDSGLQTVDLAQTFQDLIDDGEFAEADALLREADERYPAIEADTLVGFINTASSRLGVAQRRRDAQDEELAKRGDRAIVNTFTSLAAQIEARREALPPEVLTDPGSLTDAQRGELEQLRADETQLLRDAQRLLPRLRLRLSTAEFERFQDTVLGVDEPVDNPEVRRFVEQTFSDPEMTGAEREELILRAHRGRVLSNGTFNNLIATNRSYARAEIGGSAIARVQSELEAAFEVPSLGFAGGFGESSGIQAKRDNAVAAFQRFVQGNPQASELDLRGEAFRILRSLGQGIELGAIVPPPSVTSVLEEQGVDISGGAENVTSAHLTAAKARLAEQVRNGEIDRSRASLEKQQIDALKALIQLQRRAGRE